MKKERTLSIIKPDSIKKNIIGKIYKIIKKNGLKIIKSKIIKLKKFEAKIFYNVHKKKFFYNKLIKFISSSKIIVQILEGKNAIKKYREIMGNTNPKKAIKNTIRNKYGKSILFNCVHGSDNIINSIIEIIFFFNL
ncbi:putative nucleoside diphosphate kinase [Candidatus Zinderia insecticola CARI]|uniref:Putative nucleoside diphosphate kinase n=1 Tax=Zinderia insecticola (strain CARI) TaxID=871271 RepID=E0TIV7_ZINIC|nr:putative nucleoside diphosphate kinase [Candidatus Zinderia insecticola CARI]